MSANKRQQRTLDDLKRTGVAVQIDTSGYIRHSAAPRMDGYHLRVVHEDVIADRDALVQYLRAKQKLRERKKHEPVDGKFLNFMEMEALVRCERAVADACEAISQELKDAILEGINDEAA